VNKKARSLNVALLANRLKVCFFNFARQNIYTVHAAE